MKKIKDKLTEYYNNVINIFDQENDSPKLLHKRHSHFESNDSEELVTGIIVISLIIVILLSTIYYFLIFMPQQEELDNLRQEKINTVNSLITDDNPSKLAIINQIENANTIEEINQMNIENMIYPILKNSLLEQINEYKDKYNRIEVVTDNTTDIMNIKSATNYINSQDAYTLSKISVKQVDSVIVPISINRKQAASGFISQGDTVDIYKTSQNLEQMESATDENVTDNLTKEYPHDSTKIVGGSTVVSILRTKDSGSIEQNLELSQYPKSRNLSQSSNLDIGEIISSKAAGTYNEKQIKVLLEEYGVRLANYERTSNIGDLDVEYIIMIEVPRDSVEPLIENMDNIILTIPTYDAPSWVKL